MPKKHKLGYIYETDFHQLDRKLGQLRQHGVEEKDIFVDKLRNKNGSRSKFDLCLKYLRDGDILIISEAKDLSRTPQGYVIILTGLLERGITVLTVDTEFVAVSEEEISCLSFDDKLALSKQLKKHLLPQDKHKHYARGRPPALSPLDWEQACIMALRGTATADIVRAFPHVSRSTILSYLPAFRADKKYPFQLDSLEKVPLTMKDWSFL